MLFFHCSVTVPWNVDKVVIFMAEILPYPCTSGPSLTNTFQLKNLPSSLLQILCQRRKCVLNSWCESVAFVVDLHSLDDPLDNHTDENGVWKRKGSPVAYVSLHTNSGKTTVFKRSRMGSHPNHYKVVLITRWYAPTIGTTAPQTLRASLLWFMVSVSKEENVSA